MTSIGIVRDGRINWQKETDSCYYTNRQNPEETKCAWCTHKDSCIGYKTHVWDIRG